jgi:methyltransferase (TIGR00027 family)
MKQDSGSTTAKFQATFRALESVRWPAGRRLFTDRFSVELIDPEFRGYVKWAALPLVGELVRYYATLKSYGAITSGIARTRLIDDHIKEAVRSGVSQVVLLGAGYDYRALRMPELHDLHVVEMDHPATQVLKKKNVARLTGTLPENINYLETDLTREELSAAWGRSGLDGGKPAIVIWEGVAHYLGEAAVDRTIRTLSTVLAPGSLLAFTYIHSGLLDGSIHFKWAERAMKRVAGEDEPWIWGMDPARMPAYLAERGFELKEDLGADDYRARYWGPEGRRMNGFGFYRVALAKVKVVD